MKYILFVLFFPVLIYGQLNSNTLLPNVMPSNPKAFEFVKYGEIPVGKYTGIPEVSVPLFTIKAKGLDVPLNLTYHSNGFRVNEEAGWTGLGWTLQGGGSITQIVNGTDDFGRYKNRNMPNFTTIDPNIPQGAISTCSQFNFDATPNLSTFGSVFANYPKIDRYLVNGNFDVEPDVFKFSVLGYSGSFLLDWASGQFVCLSDNKIKIESLNSSPFPSDFVITVPDGHKFIFNVKEEGSYIVNRSSSDLYGGASGLELRYPEEKSFRTYQLTQIITNLGDIVTYNYSLTADINGYPVVSKQITEFKSTTPLPTSPLGFRAFDVNQSVIATSQKQSYLSSIVFNGGVVNFITSDRTDLVGAKKLDQLEVTNQNGKSIQSIHFDYDYFYGHSNGTNLDNYLTYDTSVSLSKTTSELSTRLKLKSVTELGQPPYSFEYNENFQLPKKTSLAIDYWGFYNGFLTNSSIFPDFYSFNIQRDNINLKDYAGNCKASSLDHTKAAVLNLIKYPNGGNTTFVYELNSFNNYSIPPASQGQVKSITISSAPNQAPSSHELVIIEGGSTIFTGGGILSTRGCPINPPAYSNCYLEIKHFNKNLLTYIKSNSQLNSDYNNYGLYYVLAVDLDFVDGNPSNPTLYNQYYDVQESSFLRKLYDDPEEKLYSNLSYVLSEGLVLFEVHGGCGTYNGTTNSSQAGFNFSYRDYKPLTDVTSVGGGLRVKSILTYSGSNILTHRKDFEYEGGKLMTPFIFANKSSYTAESLIISNTNTSVCQYANFNGDKYTYYSSNISTLSTSASGSYVGYDKVTEKSIDNTFISGSVIPTNGKIVSLFTNNADNSGFGSGTAIYNSNGVTLPPVRNNLDNGLNIGEQYFTDNGLILKEFINIYDPVINNNCFYGIKSVVDKILLIDPSHCLDATDVVYNIGAYPVKKCEKSQLRNSTEISYFRLNNVVSTVSDFKSYLYDSHNQVSKISHTDFKGKITETNNYYPYDFPLEYSSLISSNLISPIIKSKYSNNSIAISLNKTLYVNIAGTTINNVYFPEKNVIKSYQNTKTGNDIDLEDKVIFHNYDDYANPIEISKKDDSKICYIWGYKGQYPIAKIENTIYSSISPSIIATAKLASDSGTETQLRSELNNLRNSLPKALVTTYTYNPLIGVTSITDPKGLITYYEYDNFNRLQYIKDQYFNVLQKYCYNYLGQQTDCSTGTSAATTYKNIFRSSTFTKQFCADGSVGSTYVYSVPAGTYLSTLSQADANTQADTEIAANGQNFVNANGTCLVIPSVPVGLTFTTATASSVSFSWSAVAGATSYKIYKNGTYVSTVAAPATTGSLSGLGASTNYNVQVLATNVSVDGALCSSVSMSTVPTVPIGLTFTAATAATVNFSWSAVTGATGYKIYKNGAYVSTVAAPVTTGSLSGLTASTSYSVQVLAANVSGDGVLCTSVSMSTTPAIPTGLTFTSATASSVSFSWGAVIGATGYKIYKDGSYISTVAAPATTGSLSGLIISTVYTVQIVATNISGDGALSYPVSMSTLPSTPTGIRFTGGTESGVSFSWNAVAGATEYKIYKNGSYVSTVSAPSTNSGLSGLTAATSMGVQIKAVNASGDSDYSDIVTMTTVPASPTGLIFTGASATSVSFKWTPVTGATSYKIYKNGTYISTVNSSVTTALLSGLTSATAYGVQISAVNVSGDGTLCASVSMSTVPDVPTGLTFTSATISSLNFSWAPVAGATGYKIYKNGIYVTTVATTTGSLLGLTSSTTYYVQVLAYNASGDGILCSSVGMVTKVATTGFYKTSGTYPSIGGAGFNGSILNTTTNSLYIYVVMQSVSVSSGCGSGTVNFNGTTIGTGGCFTQYGQNIVSTQYFIVSAGGTAVPVSGSYSGPPGSQMLLAYSQYPGGSLTYWNNSN